MTQTTFSILAFVVAASAALGSNNSVTPAGTTSLVYTMTITVSVNQILVFQRNTDGTWSPTLEVAVRRSGLIVTLKPGETYGEGSTIIGLPLADMLDKQC